MATRIRTLNFLPEIFKTPTNAQFLGATLDQIVDQPNTKKIEGYIGSKFGYGINAKDYYVTEPTKVRKDYQLDPGVVFTKPNESTAKDFISYPGIIDSIKNQGGITDDNNRLFESQFYSWDSFTNLDKLINFNQYYWLPQGPDSVVVSTDTVFNATNYVVQDLINGYSIYPLGSTAGGSTNPTLTLLRGGSYTFAVNQNSQFWIQGAPGVTGYSPAQPNLQTRDVYGVSNNGVSQGIVTFDVPFKNAQDEYNFPGNNPVSVVSTLPFDQVNGIPVSELGNIDGVTALEGLTVMFYNTGVPNEIGYVSNFYDYTEFDTNNTLTSAQTITVSATSSTGNKITCNDTSLLTVGNVITFTGTPFGGLSSYSTTLPNTLYYVLSIDSSTEFTVSNTLGGIPVPLSTASGVMTGNINQGQYEQGFYSTVNETFYTITYVGDVSSPVIRLIPNSSIPTNQKITAQFGTQYGNRNFYKNTYGNIVLIPYISAPLDVLYYQDGTTANKVGIIKLIDSNSTNTLNVDTEIIGKKNFTSTNGVVFTNGLKVTFQGDVFPTSYLSGEYYVEGVGTAIELIPVEILVVPESFTESVYIPFDTTPYDIGNYEGDSYIPVTPDYITIARNSINKNAWSRSNRWFHIDVINATATYNNDPDSLTLFTNPNAKAKRPIIEFYPNLKLFNQGSIGKNPIDFFDFRTTDAFSLVAGQESYYPDVAVYTDYTASIATTNYTQARTITNTQSTSNEITVDSTTGFRVNDVIVIDAPYDIGGLQYGINYYIIDILDSVTIKVSTSPNGESVTLSTDAASTPSKWYPLSTTITVTNTDITGTFVAGQYIADSTNLLPTNTIIESVTGTTTKTLLVSWGLDQLGYINATSVASIIATDTTVDNYGLYDGARVVFASDTDTEVRNKIYVVRFATLTDSSTPIITLTEAEDGLVLPDEQTVAFRGYNYQGKEFWYDGIEWIEAQEKVTVNQPPYFDVLDSNGISFGNSDIYFGTDFRGSKLFEYGIGSGIDDVILNFPLRYSSVDNVGDISFDVSFNSDTFNYVRESNPITQQVNTGYVLNYNSLGESERLLGWQTAVSPSVQYQLFEFNYYVATSENLFTVDVPLIPATATEWPRVQVFNNNVLLNSDEYQLIETDTETTIILNTAPVINTVIQITVLSTTVSENAYFTIPINLNNNPFNENITVANIGDIRGQYQSIFYNNPDLIGQVFGSNNYRDLGNLVPWGNRIIQNSASLVLPGAFMRDPGTNLFNSLLFNSREYIKFKTLLVDTVNNTNYTQRFDPSFILDDALDQITATKSDNQPFFWSDMLPNKAAYVTNTYSFANSLDVSVYPLIRVYNFSSANYYGVLVYLTRTVNGNPIVTQLVINQDYTVSDTAPSLTITLDLEPGDRITIREYNQTYGSYVPNTPTKLGLYPSSIPGVVLDSDYNNPTYFIKGHDGSYNKLYGDYDPVTGILVDFRDQALLEFEKRVYNNLKISSVIPIREYEILPGFFRETKYSYDEWLNMYSTTFLDWVGENRLDYKSQVYNKFNQYTYNYYQSGNKINEESIQQGYWRGIYQYYYDTTTPNLTPWEMIGYTNQPSWWADRYGPAPYTSENLILWGDLAVGIDYNNGNPVVIPQAVRPELLQVLPVDSAGNLVSPFVSVVGNYNSNIFQRDWKIGDDAPVEFSYRRSSSYPFDLMRLMALMQPAKFFNLAVDLDNYKYNAEFNQYLVNDRSHLVISDIQIYGNGTAKTSYINWIVDYQKQVGIDATTKITDLLKNLDVRLVYRLAGFSDKTLLKFYVEKGTPNSRNASLLIPDESYSVLLYENQPFDTIAYSGVIIQIVPGGYAIYGNSQTHTYFTTLVPKFNNDVINISVEDVTVKVYNSFTTQKTLVPYGTIFYTVQEVSQFLINYGAYLEQQGMLFNDIENGLEVNWRQMVAEYVYWTQTGWEIGNIITLNPAAVTLNIDKDGYIVQPLTLQQSNFVLNENLYPIQTKDLAIQRDGTAFVLKPQNRGDSISYGQFNISNIEHGIVFDNVTVFDDIIYNLITGLRQIRITCRGTKTADWNGTVTAGGFILNQDNVLEWNRQYKYTKGSIVKYKNKYWTALKIVQPSEKFNELEWKQTDYNEIQKGLLPNSSTRSYESTLYYDVNKANLENDADLLSFSLIGYRPRDYLALADLTDITQVNVYQNMIKNKGTLNAASAFKGATLPQGGIDYTIYENWAIKSGEFGGVLNGNYVDFKLNQTALTGNPAIVSLTNGVGTVGTQQEVPIYSLYNYGRPVTDPNILPTTPSIDPSLLFPAAGYVNFEDVKLSAFYYSQLRSGVNQNGIIVPISDFYVRNYAWLANYLGTWGVFSPNSIGQVINAQNNLNNTVTVTFNQPHNLEQYEPFAIVNFNAAVDGYYIAAFIIDSYRVIINLILDPNTRNITGQGIGLYFQNQRVSTPSDIVNLPLLDSEFIKNKVWVDTNNDGGWAVYRKSINYQYEKEFTNPTGLTFGSSVAYTSTLGYLIGDADDGKVYRYTYNDLLRNYQLVQTITEGASFGTSIAYADDIFVISEPTGTKEVHIYQLLNTIASDDLVVYQTAISAPVGSTNWGSALAISGDKNWLYISDYDADPLNIRNNVYVYRKSQLTDEYELATIIDADALSLTTGGDKFGYSLATNYYGDQLIVGTPNQDYSATIDNYGYVYTFNRVVQNIEVQSTSNTGQAQTFTLSYSPPIGSARTASAVASNYITCNASMTGFSVDDPVIFRGSNFGVTGIQPDTVYYIAGIIGSTISLKVSRTSSVLSLTNDTGLSFNVYVQTTPIFVSVNGTLVSDSNYGIIGNTIVYTSTLNAGDIVTVSGENFVYTQTMNAMNTTQVGIHFGQSVDITTQGNEIIIGAPFELTTQLNEGAVYRYTNGGASYGMIIGTGAVDVTTPRNILLNGYLVTIPVGDASVAANAINVARLTNITATSTVDNKLVISLIDVDLSVPNQKLVLMVLDTDTLGELGINIYTQTQVVSCPHLQGATQFGSVVKFNSQGSFVASAPAGDRYSATTFDFTDDENLDNDTIFDNNATQFIDRFPNAGAVYMFDYLPVYAESLSNSGTYVYAQNVNAQNLEYGSQPLYGLALDFNDNTVVIGTPNFRPSYDNGQVIGYHNSIGVADWSVYRESAPIVDIERITNTQIYSASTNNTLINLDYLDPLQGKILGAARENIDVVSNVDPARYNNAGNTETSIVWGANHIGQLWLNTSTMRFVNYHQDSVVYNSRYWGQLFPGSVTAVYSWIMSPVLPVNYPGPGTPYDVNSFSISYSVNDSGALVPTYYYWVRNTNIVFTQTGKTLADTVVESYIANPQASGIAYMAPLLPNTFGLYNTQPYVNANDSVFHIGFGTGTNDDVAHNQYSLIRANYADDFLPGVPEYLSNQVPEGLYDRMLDSMAGVDEQGEVVPNPFLPKAVQYGILARPRQSFFINRFKALENYLTYANEVLSQFPIIEIKQDITLLFAKNPRIYAINDTTGEDVIVDATDLVVGTQYVIETVGTTDFIAAGSLSNTVGTAFVATAVASGTGTCKVLTFEEGELFNTGNGLYWEYANWWSAGYNNNTKSSLQVPLYADLSTLNVPVGTIVTVQANRDGNSETYILQNSGWLRIGLQNGTIEFKSILWDYATARLGFGDNFFDTTPYDEYPSQETRSIVRALNEQIYTDDLLIFRNKSLILLFEYIQSETLENQNYLPWLNKTSFIDVSHKIRELRPIEVFQSDNQDFLAGYLNEIKPYHVVIKEFLFEYTGSDTFEGDITDFDLPAQYNSSVQQFITPSLVYANPNGNNEYLSSDTIWQSNLYSQWYNNFGISLQGQPDFLMGTLESYLSLNNNSIVVSNTYGYPINGVITIGLEQIGYASVDPETNTLSGLTRGVNNTTVVAHIPGEKIFMDLTPVIVLDSGRGYSEPPQVTAYVDPELTKTAEFYGSIEGTTLTITSIVSGAVIVGNYISGTDVTFNTQIIEEVSPGVYTLSVSQNATSSVLLTQYVGPKVLAQLNAVMSLDSVLRIDVVNPGLGYAATPEIIIEPASTVVFANTDVVLGASTVRLYAPLLQTGDLVQYKLGSDSTAIPGLVPNQWYYVGVLENNPTVVIAFYNNRINAYQDHNRVTLYGIGSGVNQLLNLGARASAITTSSPVRENNITLKFDRTTYQSQVIDWEAGAFYGAYYAGQYNNSESVSSSSIGLQSTNPPIDNILASGQGVAFEIVDVTNDQQVTFSSLVRNVYATYTTTNIIRLTPLDSGIGDTASGSTIGFYIGMPIKFVGAVGTSGIVDTQVYYVAQIVNSTDFKISTSSTGSPILSLNSLTISSAGLSCYVGEVVNTAVLTINYPGLYACTATATETNKITAPLSLLGTGGTTGFYQGLPVFFTGDVFGGVVANDVYYVTSVCDKQNFTVSRRNDPLTISVTGSQSPNLVLFAEDTTALNLNDPIMFDESFGGITAGTLYYVASIPTTNQITVSTTVNGPVVSLSTISTAATLTSQVDVLQLSTATGNMTINVNLPVSPGQINGQLFTLYPTSSQFANQTGTDGDLIERIIAATITTVNRVALSTTSGGLTNIYVNMPFEVSTNIGGLTTGTTYYVIDTGTISVTCTTTASSTNEVTCDTTESLYVGMPIVFSGQGLGGLDIGATYYVESIVDGTHFKVTDAPGGLVIVLTTDNGLMYGEGAGFITVSTSSGGSEVALSSVLGPVTLTQTPLTSPVFDVSYKLGGYSIVIVSAGTGYAIDNTITILGTNFGGTTPLNDLVLTVNTIDETDGSITSVAATGTVPGTTESYYLKVISANELEVYANPLMTVPVSGIGFGFNGITSTTATVATALTDRFTVTSSSDFDLNDPVVFTGTVFGGVTLGQTYYIKSKPTSTTVTISELPAGATFNISSNASGTMTMAKAGDYALLPEPFYFNQSIVKYNNQIYVCVVSNNDNDFILGKWQLLDSGDRRINALDRIIGYYQPTINMPGVDLTQLVDGIRYPNSTYLGNAFAPDDQYGLDVILPPTQFSVIDVDTTSAVHSDIGFFATVNTPNYSGIALSTTGDDWQIAKLAGSTIDVTDILHYDGVYLATSTNDATPIFRSIDDGVTWSVQGTPGDYNLNTVANYQNTYIAGGKRILRSLDSINWTTAFTFGTPLTNMIYGSTGVDMVAFTGFTTVGKGQRYDYSTGLTEIVDTNIIVTSTNGFIWSQLAPLSYNGLYGVTSGTFNTTGFENIIAVGENGVIYKSVNSYDWYGVNEARILNTFASTNEVQITPNTTFTVGDKVTVEGQSFGGITAGTAYWVKTVNTLNNTIILSTSSSLIPTLTLTSGAPTTIATVTVADNETLRDVKFVAPNISAGNFIIGKVYTIAEVGTTNFIAFGAASNTVGTIFTATGIGSGSGKATIQVIIAVGDNGTIRTSVNFDTWTTQTSGTTEDLTGLSVDETNGRILVVGFNNTVLESIDGGTTWTEKGIFETEISTYNIQGGTFESGYGPEELVPGVVTDNLTMIVATRPGTNWDEKIYQHVGYNVVSVEFAPTSSTQTEYDFRDIVQTPTQISVYTIDGTTGLATAIYQNIDYTIDWPNYIITLNSSLPYTPVADKLRVDAYETGNGNQLVKADTETDPIRVNSVTGFNEIYVNCNYSATIYEGSGVIRLNTSPVDVVATATSSLTNSITCASVLDFSVNDAIRFQGAVFGGLAEDTDYYVKTISYATNSITVSDAFNITTATAGPVYSLTSDTGLMTVVIEVGSGVTWTAPLVYYNGDILLHGTTGTVTRTNGTTNAITCNSTSSLVVGDKVVFGNTMFGNVIQPQTVYYVESIVDANEFTISTSLGGPVLSLTSETGGASFVSRDFAFGIQPNGIQAKMIFSAQYDSTVDFISYTLFGETEIIQYGYTIPETQVLTGDGSTSSFSLIYNDDGDNATNAIVEINGLRVTSTDYTIVSGLDTITFTTPPALNDTIAVTMFNDYARQYLNTQFGITGVTVSNIVSITNSITAPSAQTNVSSCSSVGNLITCVSTSGFAVGQTIQFKGTAFGNILTDGTVYYIASVPGGGTTFTISLTYGGPAFDPGTASGLMVAVVGGDPAIRVTTGTAHNFSTNDLVRIDGVSGSTQLNNNVYYVHVISSTSFWLYQIAYDPSVGAVNIPVTSVSTYVEGGYAWINNSFLLATTTATATSSIGNLITVADATSLIEGTPVLFMESGALPGDTIMGGIEAGTIYYILAKVSNTITISETRGGTEFVLSTDSGTMTVSQWQQYNVDRLWVTVNGYRVPSSRLRINTGNQVSILVDIASSDEVIITSMMPSATPNEEVYMLTVNSINQPTVRRANPLSRTWLVHPLYNTDDIIYVNDVTHLTASVVQNVSAPAAVGGVYDIGLTADKRIITGISVYNNTTGAYINSENYEIVVVDLSPILRITAGSWISASDYLTVTTIEGNTIYINGEQIRFSIVDLENNTLLGIQRGANGTGEQEYIPLYSEIYSLLSENQITDIQYNQVWNSYTFNPTLGDPLQISTTTTAIFLNQDQN